METASRLVAGDMSPKEYVALITQASQQEIEAKFGEFINWCKSKNVPCAMAVCVHAELGGYTSRLSQIGDPQHIRLMQLELIESLDKQMQFIDAEIAGGDK